MAKKLESNFKNMFIVLVAVTLAAGLALSLAYNATKEPIELAKEAKKITAIREVIADFETMEESAVKDEGGADLAVYTCLKQGEVVGKAVQSYSMSGFGGRVDVMVGFLPDGTITKTVVLQHAETPGLGDKMDAAKSDFPKQFWDKQASGLQTDGVIKVSKDGGKIDAITAATISSRAFSDAVQRAYAAFQHSEK